MKNNSDLFDAHVSMRLQKKLLALILESCKTASEHCFGTFSSRNVAKDVSGVYRRGLIEDQWLGIPALFKNQVSVDVQFYKNNTGSYYELTSGVVRLTESCVQEFGDVPRQAEFRETLATDGQYQLPFDGQEEPAASQTQFLYSILTYGISFDAKKREAPSFVKIEFPNKSCTAPVDDGINLIRRYPDIALKYLSKPSFDAAVTERVRRRRRSA